MKRIRRTEITFESHERVVLSGAGSARAWCGECGEETSLLPVETVAAVGGITREEICRAIEARLIHAQITPKGETLVCLSSFSKFRKVP